MKTKKLKINVPTSWEGITLEKFLIIKQELESYVDDEEASLAILLFHLCGIKPEYISKIDSETIMSIKKDLFDFMMNTKCELQNTIKINGKWYGLEPNLSKMSYGAYLDIVSYNDITINSDWNKIMSILYRPIVKHSYFTGIYSIEEYTGKEDYKIFDKVSMDIHYGVLFFFVDLSTDLSNYILKSLTPKTMEKYLKLNTTIIKNGKDIRHLLYSQMETYNKLIM